MSEDERLGQMPVDPDERFKPKGKYFEVEPMSEEKRFYSDLKRGDSGVDVCVMDRDAGVSWDCIQLRRGAGDGAQEFVNFAVDALNFQVAPEKREVYMEVVRLRNDLHGELELMGALIGTSLDYKIGKKQKEIKVMESVISLIKGTKEKE